MERTHSLRSSFVAIGLVFLMAPTAAIAGVKLGEGTTAVKAEPVLVVTPTPIKPGESATLRANRASARGANILETSNAADERNQFLRLHARRLQIEAELSPQVRDTLFDVAREYSTAFASPSSLTLAAVANHVRAQLPNAAPEQLPILSFVTVEKAIELSVGLPGGSGELSIFDLQSLVSKRSTVLQLATGMMQSLNEATKSVLPNIGR